MHTLCQQAVIDFEAPPKKTIARLVTETREADQDFEFYPTTDAIIAAMVRDLEQLSGYRNSFSSVLDIGAGNGKVLAALREESKKETRASIKFSEFCAIEKSQILCEQLDPDVLIVGTEFAEQSLLSKEVDVIFCNPPYSEFEQWAEKIIRQAASKIVYLVIPARWEKSVKISDALKYREAKPKIVGSFDFQEADRQARAKVNLLRIEFKFGEYCRDNKEDAFDRFFREQFADLIKKFGEGKEETDAEDTGRAEREKAFSGLVVGPSYPSALVEIYNQEMANIDRNYKLIADLDAELLKEFEIAPSKILACLKKRLSGLRNDYWRELFDHLGTITERLASKSRRQLLETLHKHVYVDFTVSNILAVVIWVIKNANRYIDSQLIEVYEQMVDKCNVVLYKSNKKTFEEDRWRYNGEAEKNSHYALDYRIVTHRAGGISRGYSWEKGLDERAALFIGDLVTIARNLGFNVCQHELMAVSHGQRQNWVAGEKREFHYIDRTGKRQLLFDVRPYLNGNLHLRLNKWFILALNVEHGRLKGWLKSPAEASEELKDKQAEKFFKVNHQLAITDASKLLAA